MAGRRSELSPARLAQSANEAILDGDRLRHAHAHAVPQRAAQGGGRFKHGRAALDLNRDGSLVFDWIDGG